MIISCSICNEISNFPNFKLNIKYFISIGFVLIFLSALVWMFNHPRLNVSDKLLMYIEVGHIDYGTTFTYQLG
jgi:hypothetical protein